MKKPKKVYTKYLESDVATIIDNYMINLESAEGIRFKSLHSLPNVVTIKIANQTFLISVSSKDSLS